MKTTQIKIDWKKEWMQRDVDLATKYNCTPAAIIQQRKNNGAPESPFKGMHKEGMELLRNALNEAFNPTPVEPEKEVHLTPNRIVEAREKNELTYNELATALSVPIGSIVALTKGKVRITPEIEERFERVFTPKGNKKKELVAA